MYGVKGLKLRKGTCIYEYKDIDIFHFRSAPKSNPVWGIYGKYDPPELESALEEINAKTLKELCSLIDDIIDPNSVRFIKSLN